MELFNGKFSDFFLYIDPFISVKQVEFLAVEHLYHWK